MRFIVETVYGLYLIFLSVQDYRSKRIPLVLLISGIIFVPLFMLTEDKADIYRHVLGIIPGVAFVFLSLASRGQVGMADAVILVIMGACVSIGQIVGVIAVSLLAIAIFSMLMLLMRKLNRKSTLPFVPFLLLGYLMIIFVV